MKSHNAMGGYEIDNDDEILNIHAPSNQVQEEDNSSNRRPEKPYMIDEKKPMA